MAERCAACVNDASLKSTKPLPCGSGFMLALCGKHAGKKRQWYQQAALAGLLEEVKSIEVTDDESWLSGLIIYCEENDGRPGIRELQSQFQEGPGS